MTMYAYTLTNLLLSTRTLLAESTASFWTDAILTAYLNEGQRTIAQMAECYRTIKTVNTVASTRTVAFTGYKCIAVEYNKEALIDVTTLQPGHIKIDGILPQYWFEVNNAIGIEPVPTAIYALTLYVADVPTALSTGTDVPVIPYALCGLLTYYAVARALEQDRKLAAAMQYMSMFYNELDFMAKTLLVNLPDGIQDLRFA
jgi:hypothetical protein